MVEVAAQPDFIPGLLRAGEAQSPTSQPGVCFRNACGLRFAGVRGLLRALIFVPYVLSEVTAGIAWQIMLQSVPPARYGPIDTWLR